MQVYKQMRHMYICMQAIVVSAASIVYSLISLYSPRHLWDAALGYMFLLARVWCGETQSIEGINKLLHMATRATPGNSLALLDARVANRKDLGLGSRDATLTKWSRVQQEGIDIMEDALT